MQTGDTFSI